MNTVCSSRTAQAGALLLYLPAFCGALLLAATAGADAPAWWTDRNVIVTNAAGANDFAPVNAGQVKWIAVKAYDELEQHLPGGAGPDLATVISGFSSTNNYCPVNVGQLKNLAKPFYDRLIAEDHTDSYPWTATTSDDSDYAIANIGQVKQLFGFDLTKDTDQDGLPDWYEATISTNDVLPDGDADRDLLLNLEEYQAGTDPLNFDTDGDLLSDAAELRWYAGVDPLDADSDGDGVLDGKDLCGGTVGDPRTQIHATYVFSPFNLKLLGVEQGETYEYYFARGVDEHGAFLFFLGGTATAEDDSGELICEDTFVGHGKAQGPIGYHEIGLAEDPDGDGLSSGFEIYVLGTYPDKYDSDGDGTSDGLADSDRDGLKNVEEYNRPGSEDYDPLKTSCPVSMDSDDDGTNDPDDAFPLDPAGKKYPLAYVQGHSQYRTHSMFANVSSLLELNPEPVVEINPIDAAARGISDNDLVTVFNDRGRTTLKARVTEGVRPQVVNISEGWWIDQFQEGSVNHLTHGVINPVQEKVYEPNMHMNDVAVEVEKARGIKS